MSNVQEVWFAIGIAGLIFWGVFGLITLINWMLTVSDKKQETQYELNRLDERIDWVSGWQSKILSEIDKRATELKTEVEVLIKDTDRNLTSMDKRISLINSWQNTLILDVAQLKYKVYKKKEKTTKK